jgi:hypothetical protein
MPGFGLGSGEFFEGGLCVHSGAIYSSWDGVVDDARLGGHAPHQRQVTFFDKTFFKLELHDGGDFRAQGKENHPTGSPVESVYGMHCFGMQKLLNNIDEHKFVPSPSPMDEHSRGFVHGQEGVISVKLFGLRQIHLTFIAPTAVKMPTWSDYPTKTITTSLWSARFCF